MSEEKKTSANAEGIFEPFATRDVPFESFSEGTRFASRYQRLGAFGGGSKVGVNIEELAPGKQACPAHYHMLEEEHLLILEGRLTLRLGERRYEMGPGDYCCFPAGQKAGHALINDGTEVCRYLIIGDNERNEVVVYPDSGRVGVSLLKQGFRGEATMEYWEGEDVDRAPPF